MSDEYTSVEDRASYGIGRQMGQQLLNEPFDGMNKDAVVAGLSDMLNGRDSVVEASAIDAAFQVLGAQMEAKEKEQSKEASVEGEKYLAENAKRDEITVTESGLQFEILQAGSGDKPKLSSTVRTHYHGTLTSGKVFDSSVDRGQPAEFPVSGVIAGWTEALQMMEIGAKWRLHIPHNLAYGERGAGADIAPYSALVFDVELLEILD